MMTSHHRDAVLPAAPGNRAPKWERRVRAGLAAFGVVVALCAALTAAAVVHRAVRAHRPETVQGAP